MFAFIFGGLEILLLLFLVPFSLLAFAFWVWMLIDAAQNRGLEQGEKVAWIIVVALLHWFGGLIYFCFGRPKRKLAPVT